MIKKLRKIGLILFGFLFIPTSALLGQDEIELKEVQVSAPKFLSKLSFTGKVVDIIDAEKIRQNLGKNLGELLSQEASIVVNGSRSNPGTNQELYLRGGNTGQVLVLLDGFPLNDPSQITQVFDWNLIDLSGLERIEIIRGGLSSLYGSDAMQAVINLVSIKSTNIKIGGEMGLLAGSFSTISPRLRLNGRQKNWNWMIKYNRFQSSGISSAEVMNGEEDSFIQENIRFSLQKDFKNWGYMDFYGVISGNNTELDAGPYLDEKDYTSHSDHRSLRVLWTKDWGKVRWQQKYYQDRTARVFLNDSLEILPSAFSNYYRGEYIGWTSGYENFLKIYEILGGEAIIGFEYRLQKTEQSDLSIGQGWSYESPAIDPQWARQEIIAAYGAYEKSWQNFAGLELAARGNYNSSFGEFFNYSLNPYLNLSARSKFFFNYYTGFKIPSLYHLFSPYGNLDLKPEQSRNLELGIKQSFKAGRLQFVYFNNQVKDGILYTSMDEFPYGIYQNFQIQRIKGVELNADYSWKKINLEINLSYLKGRTYENATAQPRDILLRRPNFKYSILINYPIHKAIRLGMDYHYLSNRVDAYYNSSTYQVEEVDLGDYGIVNFSVNYQLNEAWRSSLMIRNLLDKKYEESFGYSTLPRNIQLTIGFKF